MENGLSQALDRLVKIGVSDCKLTVNDNVGYICADLSQRIMYMDKFPTNISNCDIGLTNLVLLSKLLKKYENVDFVDGVFRISGGRFSTDISIISPGYIHSEVEETYEENIKNFLNFVLTECKIEHSVIKESLQIMKTYKNTYVMMSIENNILYVKSSDVDTYRFSLQLGKVTQDITDKQVCVFSADIENIFSMLKEDITLKYTESGLIITEGDVVWVVGVVSS